MRPTCLVLALVVISTLRGLAHPIPDIPVKGDFSTGGAATLSVEVDPRCFDPDPNGAASLTHVVFRSYSEEDRADLRRKADALVKRYVEFFLDPLGRVQPEFTFTFTGHGRAALAADDTVVVLTGEWKTTIPTGLTGWHIRATPESKLAVVFQNVINGQAHPRLNVLFPGETSFTLDLTSIASATPGAAAAGAVSAAGGSTDVWQTLWTFLKQGFVHVFPQGLDHILFVLGLFLLSRAWRPLLLQVTTFTIAHTITLALATFGYVKVSAGIVEPIIAASIAAVALENIFRPRYTPWRLVVVLIFGLIHGLGFASALSDLHLPKASLAVGLIGFNLGVEGGQLAVITLAFAATAWLRDPASYRRWIVVPGSAIIALMGVWWTVQRTLL
ncbi:MAG: HupE/UreJ family protein [Chthoniobacteraceae bacterium]